MEIKTKTYLGSHGAIVVFALMFSILASFLNRAWMFDPYGWVDQWGYFGAAFFFPHLTEAVPDSPANGLIAVYLPSALLMKLFSPVVANYLRDLFVLFISTATIGIVVGKATTKKIGMAVIALMISYQYFLTTAGSSYTDGAMLFYLSLSFALLSWTQTQSANRKNFGLIVFGVLYGLMVYTAVLGIVYVVPLYLFFFMDQKQKEEKRSYWKDLSNFLKFSTLGLLVTTTTLQLIYLTYSSDFFFTSNIEKFFDYTADKVHHAPVFSVWLPGASWLVLPGTISLAALGCLLTRIRSLIQLQFSATDKLLILAPITFIMSILIQLIFHLYSLQFLYFNQTLPIYFLSLGALIHQIISQKQEEIYWLTLSGVTAIAVLLFSRSIDFSSYSLTKVLMNALALHSSQLVLFLCFLVGSSVVFLATRKPKLSPLALSIVLVLSVFSFSPSYGCFLCYNSNAAALQPTPASSSEAILRNVVSLSRLIDKIDRDRQAKLWFSESESLGPIFRQVNAVTYLNSPSSRVSKSFPAITDQGSPAGSESTGFSNTSTVILLSSDPASSQVGSLSATTAGFTFKKSNTFELHLSPAGTVFLTVLSSS